MKKVKVLYIHHGTGIGGAPISLLNLLKNINKDEFQYKVAFVRNSVATELFINEGFEVEIIGSSGHYFTHHEKGRVPIWRVWAWIKIVYSWLRTYVVDAPKYLEKNQMYDVVHLNSDVLSSWACAAKKMGFKVVCHNRDPIANGLFGIRRYFLRRILKVGVDHFISISEDNANRLGLTDGTTVIYNFVSLPKSWRTPMSDDNPRLVLYLGGQSLNKGFKTVVDSLDFLGPNILVQFGGVYGSISENPRGIAEKLRNFVKLTIYRSTYLSLRKLLKKENAEILGLLKNPLPAIDKCDMLISPFTVTHFSRPVMEACAFGKPVIVSDVEGMIELVENGTNGYIIPREDPKELAKAIIRLCSKPELAQQMGVAARKKSELLFNPDKNTRVVEGIYIHLLETKNRRT